MIFALLLFWKKISDKLYSLHLRNEVVVVWPFPSQSRAKREYWVKFLFSHFFVVPQWGVGRGGGGAGPFKAVRELMGCVQNFQDLSCWEALVTLHL